METFAQIVSGVVVAIIPVLFGYLYRLDHRTRTLERRVVQIREVRFPKTDARAHEFRDVQHRGRRQIGVRVSFPIAFSGHPKVIACLQKIDLGDATANIMRLAVKADDVQPDGFELTFETWKESQDYDAVAAWVAVGT